MSFAPARARRIPARPAGLLRQGLALWRGPPYADLRYEAALQTEITRLEELRLTTLEERIEADLAAGEASQLVPELEALVREHPLRERLRGFLMLALYRSGRQAEALETYREGRQLLDSELGLEPGPELRELERAILAHDPALDGPQRAMRQTARRRSGALLAAGGALLLAAALTAVVLVRDRGGETASGGGRRRGARPADRQAPGDRPARRGSFERRRRGGSGLGAGRGRQDDLGDRSGDAVAREFQHLVHPDRPRRRCRGALDRERVSRVPFSATSYPESVSRLDPETRVVVATIPLPRPGVVRYNAASRFSWLQEHIAVTSDAVWVVGADLGVYRIDPRTNQRVGGRVKGLNAVGIAAGGGGVWVIEFGEAARREDRSAHEHDHAEDPSRI